MRHKSSGITLIGWLFLLVPVAIMGYCVIRLTPIYLNYMKVSKAISQTATEYAGQQQLAERSMRASLARRFDIDTIYYPPVNSVQITKEGAGWVLRSNYEDVVPLFGGLSLLVQFDKQVAVE